LYIGSSATDKEEENTAKTTEIAPDIYRISIYAQWGDLQFNHFLVKDDEPLLFHTGLRGMYAEIREAVSKLISLSELRHISFSHFESDECGSLNEWLAAVPGADVICSQVGALVSVNDFIGRASRPLADGGTFATGKYRFRYCQTPPPAARLGRRRPFRRDAENAVLLGPVPSDRRRRTAHRRRCCGPVVWAMKGYQAGTLAEYVPYTPLTAQNLKKLADLMGGAAQNRHTGGEFNRRSHPFAAIRRAYRMTTFECCRPERCGPKNSDRTRPVFGPRLGKTGVTPPVCPGDPGVPSIQPSTR
jgi:hypothetical protein